MANATAAYPPAAELWPASARRRAGFGRRTGARRGQAVVRERLANGALDQYGQKSPHPSVFETPEFVVEGGVDLIGRAVRPSEFVQDAIPGDC